MKVHANALLGPKGRKLMVLRVIEQGWSVTEAAAAAGVSDHPCRKWRDRYLADGEAGLLDRSSAPRSIPHRTRDERVEAVVLLRKLRMTGAEIALCLGMALSTVSAVLLRVGLGKLSRLEPPEPPNRYERRHAGELLHVDVKKLGRIPDWGAGHRIHGNRRLQRKPTKTNAAGQRERQVGWEFVHVCVDDATRLAYVEVLTDEKAITAVGFLKRAIAFYARHGVSVAGVMTDNGSAYRDPPPAHAPLPAAHQRQGLCLSLAVPSGWAYGAIYSSSHERTAALDGWLWTYNHRRPHGALSHQPPIARLNELNNLPGSYS
ncbi:MAG TPA: IS481 family transposase [Solirubrobacteraceae bacterium]|nr:IS481 family transposase [Solirubrobacteraceae bacterium]